MNEQILQLMNKMKYPFSRCKNLLKRKKEQEKGNVTRKEKMSETKVLLALALLIVLTVTAIIIVFNLLPE